jgi:hypothetical protein
MKVREVSPGAAQEGARSQSPEQIRDWPENGGEMGWGEGDGHPVASRSRLVRGSPSSQPQGGSWKPHHPSHVEHMQLSMRGAAVAARQISAPRGRIRRRSARVERRLAKETHGAALGLDKLDSSTCGSGWSCSVQLSTEPLADPSRRQTLCGLGADERGDGFSWTPPWDKHTKRAKLPTLSRAEWSRFGLWNFCVFSTGPRLRRKTGLARGGGRRKVLVHAARTSGQGEQLFLLPCRPTKRKQRWRRARADPTDAPQRRVREASQGPGSADKYVAVGLWLARPRPHAWRPGRESCVLCNRAWDDD